MDGDVVSFTLRLLYPGERDSSTHLRVDWVSSEAGLDSVEKGEIFESNPDSLVVHPVAYSLH
jgi:hypothetical protein